MQCRVNKEIDDFDRKIEHRQDLADIAYEELREILEPIERDFKEWVCKYEWLDNDEVADMLWEALG